MSTDTDPTAASTDVVAMTGSAVVADSFGEWLTAFGKRIRSGDSGLLPVIIGLIVIVAVFQSKQSQFLQPNNLINLLGYASLFIMFGVAELFILLIGEIDLSIGFNASVGAALVAEYAAPPRNHSWLVAIIIGVAVCSFFGLVQGVIITRLRLPAFIVTLAFYLGLQGVSLAIYDHDSASVGGSIRITNNVLNGIAYRNISPTWSAVLAVVVIVVYGVVVIGRNLRNRGRGLAAEPLAVAALKVAGLAIGAIVLVVLCDQNRSDFTTLKGMPYVIPLVIALIAIYSFLLGRTRFGRYVYAIGGSAEAARRAGIKVNGIRIACFVMAGFTAGLAGVLYDSLEGGASSNFEGGTYVLYAVAVAVIGGTSLFGGRGRMVGALIGGLVIAAIYNGTNLIGLSDATQYIVNAVVLLAAVTIDSLASRRRT